MNTIWRFYRDTEQKWRWQQLRGAAELVAESQRGHDEYDRCVADANKHGYVAAPAQERLRR